MKLTSLIVLAFESLRDDGLRATLVKILRFLAEQLAAAPNDYSGPRHTAAQSDNNSPRQARAPEAVFSNKRVCIVADLGLPQCVKYRVSQKVEILRSAGCIVHVAHMDDFFRAKSLIQVSTALIFYRTRFSSEGFQLLLHEANRCGLETFYDIDDPIFSLEAYESNGNLQTLKNKEREALLFETATFLQAMKAVGSCISSTPRLADRIQKESSKPCFLWRNLMDTETARAASLATALSGDNPADQVTLFYGSGSRAHDIDFMTIAGTLSDLQDEFPNVVLTVCGYLSAECLSGLDMNRVILKPFTDYFSYLQVLADSHVCLVPLEPSAFNDCKSVVRFIDAAAVGVPTIASAVGDYAEIATLTPHLTICHESDDWATSLTKFIELNRSERHQIGLAAQQFCAEKLSTASFVGRNSSHIDESLLSRLCDEPHE